MYRHNTSFRIAWGDCDPAGIVFFPRYFALFNEATGALFESRGFPKPLLLKTYDIVGYPVVDIRATFKRACTFGEDVTVESGVVEWGRSSFSLQHHLLKDGEFCVGCVEKRVWAARDAESASGIRSKVIPDDIRAMLA